MTIRVLSIDGGGMRGLYTATYLEQLESAFAKQRSVSRLDVGKGFDLIVGTSTGAIIACGLAYGLSAGELAKLYEDNGKNIFPVKLPTSPLTIVLQYLSRPKHLEAGDKALHRVLTDKFGSMTLADVWEKREIGLALTAVNMRNSHSWVFKTPHFTGTNHRDDQTTLANACLASSAAPLYRSLAAIFSTTTKSKEIFCDGGLWANNPILVALIEVLRFRAEHPEKSDHDIEIFSLGNCSVPEGAVISEKEVHRGLSEWKFGGEAAEISMAAQEFAYDNIVRFLLPYLKANVKTVRFPKSIVPSSLNDYLGLDETRPVALAEYKKQAGVDSDMTFSEIQTGNEDGKLIQNLFMSMPIIN